MARNPVRRTLPARPRNPMRCPVCFRVIGASRHAVIGWHKWNGRKCLGVGCYGGDL